ncbi:hypothetical protein EI94DRAFT_1122538 [Lactarius quietus]|nr:hypothetical protein EI94DRAFT_1122538 [Lactarius quietus]
MQRTPPRRVLRLRPLYRLLLLYLPVASSLPPVYTLGPSGVARSTRSSTSSCLVLSSVLFRWLINPVGNSVGRLSGTYKVVGYERYMSTRSLRCPAVTISNELQ